MAICEACKGTGSIEDEERDCDICHGSGTVCDNCGEPIESQDDLCICCQEAEEEHEDDD